MKGKINKIAYIILFAILYLIVAFVSFYHGVAYMSLANDTWMAVILSLAFEIGQAAVLFALLTSKENRGKVMSWVLMIMFTMVQILGNVYSSYKYVVEHSMNLLRFFKEPVFIWTNIPDDQATVIVTYILGATLPLGALALTGMVTSFLHSDDEKTEDDRIPETIEEKDEAPEKSPEEPEMIQDTSEAPMQMLTEDNKKKTHFVSME